MFRRPLKRYVVHVWKRDDYWASLTVYAKSRERAEEDALTKHGPHEESGTYAENGYHVKWSKAY